MNIHLQRQIKIKIKKIQEKPITQTPTCNITLKILHWTFSMWHQANNVKYEHSHPFEPTWTAYIKHTEIFLFFLRIEIILKSPFRFWMTPNHSRQKISVPLNCFKSNIVWLRNLPFVAKCTFCAPLTKLPWKCANSMEFLLILDVARKAETIFKESFQEFNKAFEILLQWKMHLKEKHHRNEAFLMFNLKWNFKNNLFGPFQMILVFFKFSKYICNNRAESGQLCNSCWFP